MAQELVIKSWCDLCLEDDTNTPGETYEIPAIAGTPAFVVELCAEHVAPFVAALEAIRAVGREPSKRSGTKRPDRESGDFTCPECGHVVHTIGTLRTHVRRIHDTTLVGIGYSAGNFKCETCGDMFANGQGLAAHTRTAHPEIKQPA